MIPTPIPLPISGFVVLLLLLFVIANLGAWVLSVLLASKVYGTGGAVIVFFLPLYPLHQPRYTLGRQQQGNNHPARQGPFRRPDGSGSFRILMRTVVTCTCGAQIKLPRVSTRPGVALARSCKTVLIAASLPGPIVTSVVALPHATQGRRARSARRRSVRAKPFWSARPATRCTIASAGTMSAAARPMAAKTHPGAIRRHLYRLRDPLGETRRIASAWARRSRRSRLRCRYCGTEFNTVDPLSLKDSAQAIASSKMYSCGPRVSW